MRTPPPRQSGDPVKCVARQPETYPELTKCPATAERLKRFAQAGIKPFQDFLNPTGGPPKRNWRGSTKLFGRPTVAKLLLLQPQV
jgi:hypothetical protein